MIRTIIIDDEAKARRIISHLLEEYCPEVEVVGLAEDVPSGVKLIHKEKPDLIFLDVEMPQYEGFELLNFFEKIDFEIVFTTAYKEYAIKAFEVSAIDYLLKPIQIDHLIRAVEKVKKQKSFQGERYEVFQKNKNTQGQIKKIALPVSDGLLFIEISDIIYLKADGSYTQIVLKNGEKILVSKKIKDIENLLPSSKFFRTHRSFVIHLDYVKQFVRKDGGYIIMDNDDSINISQGKKEEFFQLWKNNN